MKHNLTITLTLKSRTTLMEEWMDQESTLVKLQVEETKSNVHSMLHSQLMVKFVSNAKFIYLFSTWLLKDVKLVQLELQACSITNANELFDV